MQSAAGQPQDARRFGDVAARSFERGADELTFQRPAIVPMEIPDDRLILPEHLRSVEDARADCDILLLRSGFSQFRESDPKMYVERSPGFSRTAAVPRGILREGICTLSAKDEL